MIFQGGPDPLSPPLWIRTCSIPGFHSLSDETLSRCPSSETLPKYRNHRCFVLGMGRIIFDILGFVYWISGTSFFRKVNSLVMDGALSQHWNELKNGYNPQDILEILAIWEGTGVVLLFLWENVIEHPSACQIGKIQNKIRIPIANI